MRKRDSAQLEVYLDMLLDRCIKEIHIGSCSEIDNFIQLYIKVSNTLEREKVND